MKKTLILLFGYFIFQYNQGQGVRDFLFPSYHAFNYLIDNNGNVLTVQHLIDFDTFTNARNGIRFSSPKKITINGFYKEAELYFNQKSKSLDLIYEMNQGTGIYQYKYKKEASGTFLQLPEESWLKAEAEFVDGSNQKWKSETKFKNERAQDGVEYYSLEASFYRNNVWQYTLTFGKNVGLTRYKDREGNNFVNNMWYEKTANYYYNKNTNSENFKKLYFSTYQKVSKICKDSNEIYLFNGERNKKVNLVLDSFTAMSMALTKRSSSYADYAKFLLHSAINSEVICQFNHEVNSGRLNSSVSDKLEWLFYLAPHGNSFNSSQISKYLKINYNEIKEEYLTNINYLCKLSFRKSKMLQYSTADAIQVIGWGKQFFKTGPSKDKPEKNENVSNCMAYAYKTIGNYELDFLYNVQAAEYFLKMSDELKAKNIDYAKSVLSELVGKNPKSETNLIRGIKVIQNFKDHEKALKLAQKGYRNDFKSPDFALIYAETGILNESKVDVIKALEVLQPNIENLNLSQKTRLIPIYRYIGKNHLADKLEKEVNKQNQKISKNNSRSKKGGGSPFGLSVSTNPGNLLWNTFPLAADLRIGGTVHQFRVNTHTDRVSDNLFGNLSLTESLADNLQKDWYISSGSGYSYAMLFNTNVDYMVVGPYFGYGQLNLLPENVNVIRTADNSSQLVALNPQITRYNLQLQFGYRYASRKNHLYFGAYYLFGAGYRTINYGYNGNLDIDNKDSYKFAENKTSYGFRHENWNKLYGIFNIHIRAGITLF